MSVWAILEWLAWAASAVLLIWMVLDAWKVGKQNSEEMLLSSREGVDELFSGEQKRGS